jgi:hypothetical protein
MRAMTESAEIGRYRTNLQDELDGAALYAALAQDARYAPYGVGALLGVSLS